jgi:hypothetical protein
LVDGERTIAHLGPDRVTNDLGQFRFWDLPPGKYYLKAMNRAGGTSLYIGESAVRYDSWEGFRPVYFGGAAIMESASPIAIEAGTQARADFKLSVEPTYKIRGMLEHFAPHQTVRFELVQGDDQTAGSRVSLNGDTGKFEIDDVPPGQYNLRATQGGLSRAEVPVTVNGGDTNGVSIALVPTVTVTGSVRVDGPVPENAIALPDFGLHRRGGPGCNVSLRSGHRPDMQMGAPLMGEGLEFSIPLMGSGPEFNIPNVFVGRYEVRIQCFGGYVESALTGSTDLLANPVLTVSLGMAPIEITMKPGGGSVRIDAKAPDLSADDSPALLLIPTFRSTGPVAATPLPDADETVTFMASNLASGDYLVYALADSHRVEYRNPGVLRNLGGGVSVRVEDNKTTEVTLPGWIK